MKFKIELEIEKAGFSLEAGDGILLLGSCFSDEVGHKLRENRFNCICNPFGVLYNPLSILNSLKIIAHTALNGCPDKELVESRLFCDNAIWHSWLHSSNFSSCEKNELEKNIYDSLSLATGVLKHAKLLVITFGTNRVYFRDNGTGAFAVANCHKQPAYEFTVKDLDPQEIISSYDEVLESVFQINPDINVLFTISPYRYIKYGLHGSNLGKAVLMLAVNGIVKNHEGKCHYFPSFEILNDELRDYRFYAEDMLHPSKQTVNYIYEKFAEYAFSANATEFVRQWVPIYKTLLHKPLFPQSVQYKSLITSTKEKLMKLKKDFPCVKLDKDIDQINRILISNTITGI